MRRGAGATCSTLGPRLGETAETLAAGSPRARLCEKAARELNAIMRRIVADRSEESVNGRGR